MAKKKNIELDISVLDSRNTLHEIYKLLKKQNNILIEIGKELKRKQ